MGEDTFSESVQLNAGEPVAVQVNLLGLPSGLRRGNAFTLGADAV